VRHALLSACAVVLLLAGLAPTTTTGQDAASRVRGSVLTPSRRPAASLWVVLEQQGHESGRALTADDGRYYLSRLQPGPYTILVKRGRATLYRAQIRLPENEVYDIVLP
jgi:hypothetical protein